MCLGLHSKFCKGSVGRIYFLFLFIFLYLISWFFVKSLRRTPPHPPCIPFSWNQEAEGSKRCKTICTQREQLLFFMKLCFFLSKNRNKKIRVGEILIKLRHGRITLNTHIFVFGLPFPTLSYLPFRTFNSKLNQISRVWFWFHTLPKYLENGLNHIERFIFWLCVNIHIVPKKIAGCLNIFLMLPSAKNAWPNYWLKGKRFILISR